MFKHFSFPSSTKGDSFYGSSSMDSSVSPTSSRGTSPSCEDDCTRRSSASSAMEELSQHFDRHNLESQLPDICQDAVLSRPRKFNSSPRAQRNLGSTNNASHLQQQRQALAHRQRGPGYSSQTSIIHEGRLSNDSLYYRSSHPSSLPVGTSSLSQRRNGISQAPSPFTPVPLSPPYSEGSESDPARVLRTQHIQKIGKELRHRASREAIPKQRVVLRKIRRRKSSLRKAAVAERC